MSFLNENYALFHIFLCPRGCNAGGTRSPDACEWQSDYPTAEGPRLLICLHASRRTLGVGHGRNGLEGRGERY